MKLLKTLDIIAEELRVIAERMRQQTEVLKEKHLEIDKLYVKLDKTHSYIDNVPTKEEMEDRIQREIGYNEKLKDVQAKNPIMLEFIRNISTNYAHMDKYKLLDAVEAFSKEYKIEKK